MRCFHDLISASNELLSAEIEKIQSFNRDIQILTTEWRKKADARSPDWSNFGDCLKDEFSKTNPRRLAACIDEKGSFRNLNIYEFINQHTRIISNDFVRSEVVYLKERLNHLRENYPEFSSQTDSIEHDYIEQLDYFSRDVGDISQEHWIEQVKSCLEIWNAMEKEWRTGSGYRNRVIKHWEDWVVTEESKKIHQSLLRKIASAWGRVLVERQG